MKEQEILFDYFKAIDSRDINRITELIHDDVEMITPIGIWRKEDYLTYKQSLFSAFTDWRFNPQFFSKEGDIYRVKIKPKGTHTGVFNLELFGLKPIFPKGLKVNLPEQEMQYKINENKIILIKPIPVPEGGLIAILTQLGLKKFYIMFHILIKIISTKFKFIFTKR